MEIQQNTLSFEAAGYGVTLAAVEATKKGAYDYLTKPFEPKELLNRLAGAFATS